MRTYRNKMGLVVAVLSGAALVGSAVYVGAQNDKALKAVSSKAQNADMLIRTLSEEKTEIQALAAQQAHFKKLGGKENERIVTMFGNWIRDHKAAGPTLEKLIKQNGGNPADAKIIKAPVLGDKVKMLHATHKDHMAAVESSQARYVKTTSSGVKKAMKTRAGIARKHLAQMEPIHNSKNCAMCRDMGHNMGSEKA